MCGIYGYISNNTHINKNNENQSNSSNDYLEVNSNLSSEITRLNELLKSGVLTQEEFDKAKKKLLDN